MAERVCGLVLAAGGSRRLGRPKQLVPYGGRTLLDHTLDTARACGLHQLVCAVGGAADDVVSQVDLDGFTVVRNAAFGELLDMHGDKAVWKLLERHGRDVVEVPIGGPVPRDVDTWADYEAVLR